MIKKIEYENKEGLQNDEDIPNKNKVTDDDMNEIKDVVNSNADELGNKVSKEDGKGLSEENFTTDLKTKLENLNNYNDAEIKEEITSLQEDLEALTIKGQAEGESIDLYDSSSARVKSFEVMGNSKQDGEPSLDNRVEVKSCGDDINILPTNVEDWEQGSISGSGNTESTTRIRTKNYIEVKPLIDYYISVKNKDYCFLNIVMYNKNDEYITGYVNIDGKINGAQGLKINLPEECEKIRVLLKRVDEGNIAPDEIPNIKVKLSEGSTETPYSPYGMGSHKINMVNKNFYNKNIQYEIGQGYSNDGIWGNYNGGWASNRYEDIPIEENCTFTLVGNIVPTSYTSKFFYFDIYGKLIKYEEKKLNSGKIIFTTPANTKYLSFQVFNGTTNKLNQETIQIEKGSFNTEIVYYEGKSYVILTQQPMRAVGNVRDCFVIKEDGKRYERHYIDEYLFTSDEQRITIQSTETETIRFKILKDLNFAKIDNNTVNYKSNYFKCYNYSERTEDKAGIFIGKTTTDIEIYIRIPISFGILTVEALKTWFDNNNCYLYKELETPLDLECTEEQNQILDKLDNLRTYKNVTHIFSNDEVGAYVKVEYRKDLETYIMNNIQSSLETQTQNTISTIEEEGQE